MGGLIAGGDKSIEVGPQLVGAVEARKRRWGVVKMHLRVPLPPAVAFGLVDVEVVENDRRGATSALEISYI